MIAQPNDFKTIEEHLQQLARFGNGQSREEADYAAEILKVFLQAKSGVIGRMCWCGRRAEFVRKVPDGELYCFCQMHAKMIDDHRDMIEKINLDKNGRDRNDSSVVGSWRWKR